MKINKIIKVSIILFLLPIVVKAQINDNFKLNQDKLIFQKNNGFDELTTSDNTFTEEIGSPKLPARIELFVVPFEANVSGVQITSVRKEKIKGSYYVYPAQPPALLNGSKSPAFVEPNPLIYNSNNPYPGKTVEIISDSYMFGYHIVRVKIYPVEYLPKNRELYLQDISFSINYSVGGIKNASIKPKQSYKRAESTKSFIKDVVKNANDVEKFNDKNVIVVSESKSLDKIITSSKESVQLKGPSVREELIPEYIIITRESLKPTFQTLADWKTKKGVPTIIKTIEEIEPNYSGVDLQEKIRNYLKEAYYKWGSGLFVLLGGDTNIVPAKMIDAANRAGTAASDLYYATLGGKWNIMQFNSSDLDYNLVSFIGRAPVENVNEATIFVNKILTYEKLTSVTDLNYVRNLLITSSYISSGNCAIYEDYHKEHKEYGGLPSYINRTLMFENNNCSPTNLYSYRNPIFGSCPSGISNLERIPGGSSCITGDVEFNKTNFISALNNGGSSGKFHVIYHLDHGSPTGIGTASTATKDSFENGDANAINNGNAFQILMAASCGAGDFTQDCLAERYLNNANGGGVAFLGNSEDAPKASWPVFRDFLDAIYSNNNGRSDLGSVFQKAFIARQNTNSSQMFHLLGDPEMQVWSNTPQNLTVTISPASLVSGVQNEIIVSVNNLPVGQVATICLQKGDEGYATQTITGSGSKNFTFTPLTSGNVTVTVTARNFKPYEATIPVTVNQSRNLNISNLTFNDDKIGSSIGNNDLKLDAGETIEMNIDLKNDGVLSATNVSATLTCNSSYITFGTNNSSYGTINSGSIITSLSKYVFTINKNAPEVKINDSNPIVFTLQITGDSGISFTRSFNIEVFRPEIELGNKKIISTSDGDSIVEPGETVTFNIDLFNSGNAQATGVNGVLQGLDPLISSNVKSRSYPVLNKFETKTNSNVYQFTVSSSYIQGNPLYFSLKVTNEFGYEWYFYFDLLDRPNQIDITTVNFKTEINQIYLFWPNNPNIKGYNIYRYVVGQMGSNKLNSSLITEDYYVDTNVNERTQYFYMISGVSYTGNEGELSQPLSAWTSGIPLKPGFPVAMNVGRYIETSQNVSDINNDNLLEIFTPIQDGGGKSYIIGLKHDGTELFDIDNNPATYSGFAETVGAIKAPLAIGDLNNSGNYQVISATRPFNSPPSQPYIYSHSVKDTNLDNKPDLLWQKGTPSSTLRAPMISNIDNSPDGSKEVVLITEQGHIEIYNSSGTKTKSWQGVHTYEAPVLADIDGDGDKEIIAGAKVVNFWEPLGTEGIYIWHHDGTPFGVNQPFFKSSSYVGYKNVIVCDLDNNGDMEILFQACSRFRGTSFGYKIIAIHHDGSLVNGWGGAIGDDGLDHSEGFSVGDLDNNGSLEVVALKGSSFAIYSNTGVGSYINLPANITVYDGFKATPILADVDGDSEVEIVFSARYYNDSAICAINKNGSLVTGFPFVIENSFVTAPCVADVDNDGKNELISASETKIYMWRTEGSSEFIEWGSERHDPWNTGCYGDNSVQPTIPTVAVVGENLTINSTNANGYVVQIYQEPFNPSVYDETNIGLNTSISLNQLNIVKGRLNKIRVRGYINSKTSPYSDEIEVYYAYCDEKTQFLANSSLIPTADIQKYESTNSIISGTNIILPTAKSVIFSAKNEVSLLPGFEAPVGSDFSAYIEGCANLAKAADLESKTNEVVSANSIENESETEIKVYPNPTSGNLIINSGFNDQYNVKVVDLQGRIIVNQKASSNIYMLDLSKQSKGLYILQIQRGLIIKSFKVVLQ